MPLFETVEHSIEYRLSPNVSFHFRKNGHILGAASVVMSCNGKTIVFSGDVGRYESRFFLPPPLLFPKRISSSWNPPTAPGCTVTTTLDELADVINRVTHRHGSLIIPSFAVGRAQEIMHLVNTLKTEQRIPASLPVFLDSPMAADATQSFAGTPTGINSNTTSA